MKKITLSLFYLIGICFTYAQTSIVLVDEGVVPNNFSFCFDDAPICTLSMPVNNETQNDNPSTGNVIQLEFTTSTFFGAGIDFEGLISPSMDANGSFVSMLFRSTTNISGNVPVNLQLWLTDDDKIDAQATYTKTDGTWQKLIFDYTNSTPFGTFTSATIFKRVLVFPNINNPTEPGIYQFDEIILDQTLSVDDFELNKRTKVFVNNNGNTLNIKGEIHGENFRLFDISGRVLKIQSVEGELNKIDITTFPAGVYFLSIERRAIKFMIPSK